MGKSNTFANDLLNLIYRAVGIANIADNAATAPLTNLYVAFHTADPGGAGSQVTNEAAYTSYARVAVARPAGFTNATAQTTSPAANIDFPQATGGSETITHFSVGVASSGASKILHSGTVTPNITINAGVTPRLTTATTIGEG